uniref:CSON001100 protein n=1 Tax=Culicoides sonorensis TaxID=179676 RepID=A0A336MIK3_CULSO
MHHIPKILTLLVIILNTSEIVIGADTNETIEWTRNPEVELPPCLIICKRNVAAQERNECIKNSIKGYLPSVKEGYAPLGIEPIEPYILPKNRLEFRQGELYAKMIMKDTAIAGISKTEIINVRSKVNSQKLYIEMDVRFPKIFIEADYKGRGGYNEFKVNSAGHAKMTLTNATGTWKFLGKTETIENEEYMIINSLDLANFVVQNMHFDISGLFPDPDVNEFALAFLNQVWQSVYQQILPQLKSVWEPATLDMVNKIFARVPYRRLLLKE